MNIVINEIELLNLRGLTSKNDTFHANIQVNVVPFLRYSLAKVQNRYIWLFLFGLTP